MSIEVMRQAVKGTAAGVPYVALPPGDGADGDQARLVVSWHMMDPPRTEAAIAAALPMTGVPAWRVYFGLPKFGTRIPDGGFGEVMRLASEDFILKLYQPVVTQAAAEAPSAIGALRGELSIEDGPVGLLGGSMGSAVALLLLAKGALPVTAAAIVSPVTQVAPVAKLYNAAYEWTDEALAAAKRFDFVARASEIAKRHPQPAVLIVAGERDHAEFREPAAALRDTLLDHYDDPDRVKLATVPGMRHAIAKAPGFEPAPQTTDAERVQAVVTEWFHRHLGN